MFSENIIEKLKTLPERSGVYIMRDLSGTIIYIGKAVVLKNRVRQYFNNSPKLPKVQAMVDNVADFDYMITLSEKDALTLESNLVKKHKPKYNILLKDDKASPYIKIDMSENFPTVEVTRRIKRDGAKYFGPYFNGIGVWDIVGVIRAAYRMRTCPKKFKKNMRECLNYHIELCLAPCCNRITEDEYAQIVNKVVLFLSGREDTAERLIGERMQAAAEKEEFERAISYRNQLDMLKRLKERTVANLGAISDLDLFAYVSDGDCSVISIALVRGGKMMGIKNFSVTDASLNTADALSGFITQYYGAQNDVPSEICLPEEFDIAALEEFLYGLCGRKTQITFPKIGTKKSLLRTAEDNARDYLEKSVDKVKRSRDMTLGACKKLCDVLHLKSARRIECYDISNISGVDKVASQVVFIDGEAAKSEYRKFKIKTVEGADDFASMSEVLRRRIERATVKQDSKFTEMPDLIVVDGGKGQLSSAHESMKILGVDIPMVGLAKREEEIFTVGKSEPIILRRDSNALKLLQRIRDEAHRFAITYHRNLRKSRYVSMLEKINGVGKVKCKILLAAFENFADLMDADVSTLCAIKGIDKRTADKIFEFFKVEKEKQ